MCCTCNSARTVLRITSGFEPINNTKMKKNDYVMCSLLSLSTHGAPQTTFA